MASNDFVVTRSVWYGKQVSARYKAKALRTVFQAAEVLLEYSNRSVPFDEGTLQKSGQTDVDPLRVIASVSYDMPYAVRLHEHPEYHFQNGRRGKWLELALQEIKPELLVYMAKQMRGAG